MNPKTLLIAVLVLLLGIFIGYIKVFNNAFPATVKLEDIFIGKIHYIYVKGKLVNYTKDSTDYENHYFEGIKFGPSNAILSGGDMILDVDTNHSELKPIK